MRCLFVLAAAALLLPVCTHAAPPQPDFANLPPYLKALNQSADPVAKAIRVHIASGPADLAKACTLAEKAGIATRLSQLVQLLPPAGQNAALLYKQLEALRKQKPLRFPPYAQSLSGRVAYTPAQMAAVKKEYDARPDIFTLLHQAADKPQCVFARDWAKDAFSFPGQFSGFRETARELKTEGVLSAERGRYTEAVATESRVYRVALHAADEPTLISYLVAEAIDSIATSGMQDVLSLAGPNADVDVLVGQAVSDSSARPSLRHALSGEAALSDAGFSLLRRAGPGGLVALLSSTPDAARPTPSFTPQERRFYADLLNAAEAVSLHNVRATVRAADTAGASAALARESREAQAPTDDLVQEVARRLSPLQFDILSGLPARAAAARSVTCAAAAVLVERAKTGAFPVALPGAFLDPYRPSKMLQYRREGAGGFVVYSAGPDGKGDGGRPGDRALPSAPSFRYPSVPIPVPAADAR